MTTRKNILVIDPNELHFELLRSSLASSPVRFTLTRAPDTEKGTKLLRSHKFDIVLTENFESNGNSGWLSHIRQYANGTPVIVLTSVNNEQKVISAMKLGADDYIIKNRSSLGNLAQVLLKTSEKKKKKEGTPQRQRFSGLQMLTNNLKTITSLINQPSKSLELGKKQLRILEKELEHLKGTMKNWIP